MLPVGEVAWAGWEGGMHDGEEAMCVPECIPEKLNRDRLTRIVSPAKQYRTTCGLCIQYNLWAVHAHVHLVKF